MNSILLTLAIGATLVVALPEGKHGGRPFPEHNHFVQISNSLGRESGSSEEGIHRPNGQHGRPVKPQGPNGSQGSFPTNEQIICLLICKISPQHAFAQPGCVCSNVNASSTTEIAGTVADTASPADTTVSGIASDTISDVSTTASSPTS